MEDGILKRGLLSLKNLDISELLGQPFRATTIYKHYILCFKSDAVEGADCVVIDTQKRTATKASTGLNLRARTGYSICYWKNSTFVIFGGYEEFQTAQGFGFQTSANPGLVKFLHVIEEDSKIAFKAEVHLPGKSPYWNTQHTAHIYKDKMYIVGGKDVRDKDFLEVWRYDLIKSKEAGDKCEIKSVDGAPKQRTSSTSVLMNGKIYILGGYQATAGGGLFGKSVAVNDLFALDLENMQWVKIKEDNFLPTPALQDLHAEVVDQKIYMGHKNWNEFFIYDPVKDSLQQSEGVSPSQNFQIKSHQDRSILFRINTSGLKKEIEFQDLSLAVDKQIPAPIEESKASLFVQSRKNILPQPLHMNLLWKDKPFADITFVVEGEEIRAHRIILLKCHYFQDMFNSGMKEASSNKINVPDISPTNFKAILEYIYFGKITLTESLALDLIILADMYCMAELKADCETYLSANLKAANLLKTIKASETADSRSLEERIILFLIGNIEKLQQDMDINEIPHELLVKSMMAMKHQKMPSAKGTSFFSAKDSTSSEKKEQDAQDIRPFSGEKIIGKKRVFS